LPNRRQVRIAEDQKLFDDLPLGREKLIVARRLTGRLFEASQIDAGWRVRAEAMAALRDDIQIKIGR
jgi:RNA-directed DNA polymerase